MVLQGVSVDGALSYLRRIVCKALGISSLAQGLKPIVNRGGDRAHVRVGSKCKAESRCRAQGRLSRKKREKMRSRDPERRLAAGGSGWFGRSLPPSQRSKGGEVT